MEEGWDKVRAATFAYEITAMPMLTGTLITAVGFMPIGIASARGIHLCHLWRDGDCAGAELDCVGVFRALPGHAHPSRSPPHDVAGGAAPARGLIRRFTAASRAGELVRGAPLETIAIMLALSLLGVVGMGKVQQQFFPDSSRPEFCWMCGTPKGTFHAG